MNEIKTIGSRIRMLRHQKRWSQTDVADRLYLSLPAISKIETGACDVSLTRLEQISALFELTVIQLLTFEEATEPQDSELQILAKKLRQHEDDVIDLRKKVILLYERVLDENR